MTRTNRTNPAYAFLAYRRAIVQHVTNLLVRDYTAPMNSEPNKQIYSDDVMRGDEEVPVAEVVRYIEELQQEDASLVLEMNKFEFRKIEEPKAATPKVEEKVSESTEPKEPQGGSGPAAPPGQASN